MKKPFKILSQDPYEMEDFLSRRYAHAKVKSRLKNALIGRQGSFLPIGGISLEWMTTLGDYDVFPIGSFDANFIHVNITGGLRVEASSFSLTSGPTEISAFAGQRVSSLYNLPDSKRAVCCIHHSFSSHRLSDLFERQVGRVLAFAPSIEMKAENTAKFAKLISSAESNGLFEGSEPPPSVERAFTNFIFDTAVSLLPNNFSELLEAPSPPISPRQVRLAVDFMHENLACVPSPDEIAAASGVGVRSLQYSFKRHFGQGLMEYQKRLRLMKAKDELLANRSQKIETIARRFGFKNVGRFADEFRKVFGETPSQLRRR